MKSKTIKRFYKLAEIETGAGGHAVTPGGYAVTLDGYAVTPDGYAVTLDGKSVKTPAGKRLEVASRPLAEAIAAEWNAQGAVVSPSSMPMTQLASTAIDRVSEERAAITLQVMRYGATDLLCYRADGPAELVRRQAQGWQPILDWAADTLSAPLSVTSGVVAILQPATSLAALEARIGTYCVWRATVLQAAAAATGSLLLGLALAEGRVSGTEAWALSDIDEAYQIEQWGEDYEAADRRARLKSDILAAERFLALTSPSQSAT